MSLPSRALAASLSAVLNRLCPTSPAAVSDLAAVASSRSFGASEWLLRAGERAEWSFLLTKGLVREFYIGATGQEHVRTFVTEGAVTGSLLDLLSDAPSRTWIQALEATETIAWRYADFDLLTRRHGDLQEVARKHAEGLYVRQTIREHEMLALTAKERHERWLEHHADLDARIRRSDLASYLGITPEHLSRLRRDRVRPARPA